MKELRIGVERAVRPVQATFARKRRMRQELLAHLTGIFEEERARCGDEQMALSQALQRFGDPVDLARDLQASVPQLERRLAGLFLRKPGERELRHALRLAALAAVSMFVGLCLMPLIMVVAGRDWSNARIGLAPQVVITACAFLSVLLGYGFCRQLANRVSVASLLGAAAHGVAALLVGFALVAGSFVAQPDNPLWEFMLRSPGDPLALSALVWFTIAPLVLMLVAALFVRVEFARERDWRSLEIGK